MLKKACFFLQLQHYASFLNCLRTKEFKEALDSLYRYFDRQQWQGESAASKIVCDSEESEAERCHRFRYAALILAALHCRFGHRYQVSLHHFLSNYPL